MNKSRLTEATGNLVKVTMALNPGCLRHEHPDTLGRLLFVYHHVTLLLISVGLEWEAPRRLQKDALGVPVIMFPEREKPVLLCEWSGAMDCLESQ